MKNYPSYIPTQKSAYRYKDRVGGKARKYPGKTHTQKLK